jgi:hypothetical protein
MGSPPRASTRPSSSTRPDVHPALEPLRCDGRRHAHAGVDCDAALGPGKNRVQIEFGQLGEVGGEPSETQQQVGQRSRVGSGGAPEAGHETTRLAAAHELPRVEIGERREPERRLAHELGECTSGAESHERTEDGVLNDARQQLDAAAHQWLHEHRELDPSEPVCPQLFHTRTVASPRRGRIREHQSSLCGVSTGG